MICNAKLCPNCFSVNFSVLAVVFRQQFSKKLTMLPKTVGFSKIVDEIQQVVRKRSQKIHYDVICITFHFLFIHCPFQNSASFKNNSKTKTKKNGSCCLFNFLQTQIFWKFYHISRTYNQINYRNIWFAKLTRILIMMAQVHLFDIFFSKKAHTLMPLNRKCQI